MLKEDKKFILRGICVNYLHLLVGFIFVFFLTPIIIRHVGQSAYGLWAIFSSMVGYFLALDFGMNTAVAKYTAEYRALNNHEALNKIASTTFVCIVFVCILIVLISIGITPFIPYIFNIPDALVSAGKTAFLIMAFNAALILLSGVFGNIIYGHQRVDVWKTFTIVQLTANILLTILFLRIGLGLIGMAVAVTISNLILISLYLTFLQRSGYCVSIRPQLAGRKVLKEIAPYSIRTFILVLTSRILYYTSSIIIGIFLGVSMVTPYDVAYKLCFYITSLFGVISITIFPRFSKLYALGDIDGLQDLYLKATKISLAIMSPLAIFFVFFGQPLINLWVGEENFVGMDIFLIFILMDFIHAVGTPAGLLLQGIGRNKTFVYSETVNAGLNLILSVILVRELGLLGVALGGLTAHLCTSTWVVPLLACRHTRLPIKKLMSSAVLPPLFVGIVSGVAVWMFKQRLFQAENFLYLCLNGIIILTFYAAFYVTFGSTKEERRMYLSLIPDLRHFLKR
jgi:O-antigen/teichoic acid export membrane protein